MKKTFMDKIYKNKSGDLFIILARSFSDIGDECKHTYILKKIKENEKFKMDKMFIRDFMANGAVKYKDEYIEIDCLDFYELYKEK
jgi:hypothetical protein